MAATIAAYKLAPALRDTIGGKKRTATASIPAQIKAIREKFLVLDNLVEGAVDNEKFVETYFYLREIGQKRGGRTSNAEKEEI